MEKDLINEKEKPANEPIVITGECGDSMWDAVLQQAPSAPKGGTLEPETLKCFLKKPAVGVIVD
jgi:hypothetical protein